MAEADKPRKVAIGAMVRFAYRSVFGRLELIPELGWIMLLALLAALILPDVLLPARRIGTELRLAPQDYARGLVAFLAATAFAVRWHQSILIGDPRRQPLAMFLWGWVRFLIYTCIIFVVIGVIALIAGIAVAAMGDVSGVEALVGALALAAFVLTALLTARCALIFPAAAAGKPLGVGAAWRMMRGNSWRLLTAMVATALPLVVATVVLASILVAMVLPASAANGVTPPLGLVILIGVFEAIFWMLLAALGASVLAGFYRQLMPPA